MKSLEIVNERINKCLGYLDCNLGVISKEELETIKDDLEVLELIKNKEVDWQFIRFLLVKEDNLEEVLETYNYSGFHQLTMEELLKLKQWLEVNENE